MKEKHINKIDALVLVFSLFGVLFLVGYTQPLVISPVDDFSTSERGVLFSFENAEVILIDDNLEFSSKDGSFEIHARCKTLSTLSLSAS